MKLSPRFLLFFAIPLCALPLPAFSGGLFAQAPNAVAPAASASKRLHLDVVVTPKAKGGAPVAALGQGDFTVLDNGQVQPLTSFREVSAAASPVKTFLVIDAININYTRLAYERDQIGGFLKAHDGTLVQPTSLAVVTDTTEEATPGFTTDGHALEATLNSKTIGLRDIRRSSGFYGAEDRLDLSLRALEHLVSSAAAIPGRKAILWVSPGWPLLSGPEVQFSGKQQDALFQQIVAISAQLREANVTLYSVDPLGAAEGPGRTFYYEQFVKGVRKPSQVQLGDLGLQVLATQSGGLALSSSNDITSLLERCAEDTTHWYEISYQPPPADAPLAYHEIQVKVSEPHLVARTRQGYYTQP